MVREISISAKKKRLSNSLGSDFLRIVFILLWFHIASDQCMLAKLVLDDKIILSITVRTEGTQATYNLTQTSITREDKSFTERFLKTFSSTFYHCSDCKSFDWTQQSAAVYESIVSFKMSCNRWRLLKPQIWHFANNFFTKSNLKHRHKRTKSK